MRSTFILKRKLYANDEEYSGSRTKRRLAYGLGGTAAAALALAGAKKGAFGKNIMKSTNQAYGKLGGWTHRNISETLGNKMMKSAKNDLISANTGIIKSAVERKVAAGTTNSKILNVNRNIDQVAKKASTKAAEMQEQSWKLGGQTYKDKMVELGKTNREKLAKAKAQAGQATPPPEGTPPPGQGNTPPNQQGQGGNNNGQGNTPPQKKSKGGNNNNNGQGKGKGGNNNGQGNNSPQKDQPTTPTFQPGYSSTMGGAQVKYTYL